MNKKSLTIGYLIKNLIPSQLWAIVIVIMTLTASGYAVGSSLTAKYYETKVGKLSIDFKIMEKRLKNDIDCLNLKLNKLNLDLDKAKSKINFLENFLNYKKR